MPIVDAVSIGVIRLHGHTVAATALDGKHERVIVACSATIRLNDVTIVLSFRRILQKQLTPLEHVPGRSARAIGLSPNRATYARQIYGGIDLKSVRQVNDVVADVIRRHQPVHSNSALDAEVPLIHVRIFKRRRNA